MAAAYDEKRLPTAELVTDTRINRRIYRDPAIFDEELAKIFAATWLYIGHESEIPRPGDFVTRSLATQPVILCRDEEGKVRVLFNTCAHRGAAVCREERGNTKHFTCLYHAWVYRLNGELAAVPGQRSYQHFDRAELGLKAVPRVESYRGLIFCSLNAAVGPLMQHLGRATEYIDMALGAPSGTEVIGMHRYEFRANWKLLMENTIDGYHPGHLHAAIARAGQYSTGQSLVLGNGHGLLKWKAADAKGDLGRSLAMSRTATSLDTNRVMFVFPNVFILHVNDAINVRCLVPVAPQVTQINAWAMGVVGEPEEVRNRRSIQYSTGWGPAGIAGADDVEAFEACQEGFRCSAIEWSDMSKGYDPDDDSVGDLEDENSVRGVYRQWREMMGRGA